MFFRPPTDDAIIFYRNEQDMCITPYLTNVSNGYCLVLGFGYSETHDKCILV